MPRPADAAPGPLARYTVTVRHDVTEDRLLLQCSDASGNTGLLQLTRRITSALLHGLMRLLSNDRPTLLQVPADLQHEMLHFEHQSALAQAVIHPATPAQAQPDVTFLVTRVDVSQMPEETYALHWAGPQERAVTMTMSRLDLHCLAHVLQQHAQAAGWDLPAVPRWMQPDDDLLAGRANLS